MKALRVPPMYKCIGLLQELIATKRPYQFSQGLDERMLAQSSNGELMAQMLSQSKYHGNFTFAIDIWKDRGLIERALKIFAICKKSNLVRRNAEGLSNLKYSYIAA